MPSTRAQTEEEEQGKVAGAEGAAWGSKCILTHGHDTISVVIVVVGSWHSWSPPTKHEDEGPHVDRDRDAAVAVDSRSNECHSL